MRFVAAASLGGSRQRRPMSGTQSGWARHGPPMSPAASFTWGGTSSLFQHSSARLTLVVQAEREDSKIDGETMGRIRNDLKSHILFCLHAVCPTIHPSLE